MKTPIRFTALALSLLLSSVAMAADLKIGVSMSSFDDNYLTNVRKYMDQQAKSYPKGDGVQLQFEDARADVVKQLSQVENFIGQKVDAIIVNPVDTASTARISKAAIEAGIPLVYVNRRPDQKDLPKGVAAVTSDDEEAGKLQMQYIADKLGGKGKIVILLGDLANNSTQNRTKGVKEILAKYPGIEIEQEQTGTWLRQTGMDLVNNWLTQGRDFQAVLANNDEMAIGAAMALKSAGKEKGSVLIAGVDGTPDGLNAITKGEMAVSVFQDAKGQAVGSVEAARKLARNETIEQNIVIPFKLITPDNVKDFK
ncbi:sugar ABC transporter substrate-binding protein [Pseudomonas lurida]|jgi:inositol transport system substrate-binding protein|uniref:Sugar ABC transporter substrate-binding protein n=1 Tax=Pseudomonas quebecensis TaxID=2995174 RepID=A0ABY6QAW9_9PSED|nr:MULTISPECIES: sugar ABC transporter substrate-binding protein [Pseudomonas]MBA1292757.1 sugar ABC transporter substrate-binding protein [Pseudomonas lurida]MCP1510736.1 inositol transport system substrate-binding protein [Pseudomonas rhodesiae]MCX4067038.1 sugar ABC transporter substrate-binding protein [Pseudomonas quebecensis]MDF9769550.1 inositol transport system substrate-binding protein [Pseudomonas rhodesiae]UZW16479.1 sugar ABC transporter substrate-binding protein [Pseudomonas quebe